MTELTSASKREDAPNVMGLASPGWIGFSDLSVLVAVATVAEDDGNHSAALPPD
jgi:hypothetical protein